LQIDVPSSPMNADDAAQKLAGRDGQIFAVQRIAFSDQRVIFVGSRFRVSHQNSPNHAVHKESAALLEENHLTTRHRFEFTLANEQQVPGTDPWKHAAA
jgi:hypothetical protein